MHEAAFIDLLRTAATSEIARGLTDDAAVFGDLVLTHDMMVEGTHYFPDADPADVAWKLVVRNLSDLAAKGAAPLGVLLGYMLGDDAWDRRFAEGLHAALSHFGTALWGGDTASGADAAPRALGMTAIGRATHQPVPSRSGAGAGNTVWIAGTIGDAFMGWRALADRRNTPSVWTPDSGTDRVARDTDPARWRFATAFHRPMPLLTEGALFAAQVTAMMDISDGVLLDARRMALASDATIAINFADIPFSDVLRAGATDDLSFLMHAASFGDDYALLFTLPPGQTPACPATCIGQVLERQPDTPLLIDGALPDPKAPLGWQHRT